MKKLLKIIIIIFPTAICFAQSNLKESIARLDSNNTFLLKALIADTCKPVKIWESLLLKFDFNLYKKTLTDVSDSLYEYTEKYPFQIISLTKDPLNEYSELDKKLKLENLSYNTGGRSDYENMRDRFMADITIFQNKFDEWKLDPVGHKKEIEDYDRRLNEYISELVFDKENAIFASYSILYAMISHVTQKLRAPLICKNQIRVLFSQFKISYGKNNINSITGFYDKLTDIISYLKNKYPTAWLNKEIIVVPRVEFYFSRLCWVLRFYALYSGSIYKGFSYDRIHYWGLEWYLFSCVAEDGHTFKVGEEWDPRCAERLYPDQTAIGPPSANAIQKSLNDESFKFNQVLNWSTNIKILIDNLVVSYN